MSDSRAAFPRSGLWTEESPGYADNYPQEGMSLRDYFAAKAMQGMIVKGCYTDKDLAEEAYAAADAMLKEREQ